jgi:hypothetical protein
VPAALEVELLDPLELVVEVAGPVFEPVRDALDLLFFAFERFLDGPHVLMAPPKVPIGCHTRP